MLKQIILKRINKHILANYQKLNHDDFVLGAYLGNRKCHINSVQKVKEKKAIKVYLCFAIDKDDGKGCIHFINSVIYNDLPWTKVHSIKYQDNTWGYLYSTYDYYLIREITEEEQEKIWDVLQQEREKLVYKVGAKWCKFMLWDINII
jgi:hypothetical protein